MKSGLDAKPLFLQVDRLKSFSKNQKLIKVTPFNKDVALGKNLEN